MYDRWTSNKKKRKSCFAQKRLALLPKREIKSVYIYVCEHYPNAAEIPSPNSQARVLQSLFGRAGVNNPSREKYFTTDLSREKYFTRDPSG